MTPEDLSIGYEAFAYPMHGLEDVINLAGTKMRYDCEQNPQFKPFFDLWRKVESLSLLGLKAFTIYQLAFDALKLPGDFVECGVYKGGTSFLLGMLIQREKSNKLVHMFDTFEGLPAPNRQFDKAYGAGGMAWPISEIFSTIGQLRLHQICCVHKGLFSDTKQAIQNRQLAFAHLDFDLYDSTREALDHIYPRLAPGAPLVLDDYYDESHGVMQAVNAFAARTGALIHLSVGGQAYIIKDEPPTGIERQKLGSHEVLISREPLASDYAFLAFLERIAEFNERRHVQLRNFLKYCKTGVMG